MTRYAVVVKQTAEDLSEAVESMLKHGYKLQGGVSVSVTILSPRDFSDGLREVLYAQAMTRERRDNKGGL
jgi:hypothetical protein